MTKMTPFPQEHRKLDLVTIAGLTLVLWMALIIVTLVVL